MAMPKGVKVAKNPKNYRIAGRLDEETYAMLNKLMKTQSLDKSKILRNAIRCYYEQNV